MVIVVVSLDPHNIVETEVYLDMQALGLWRATSTLSTTRSPGKPGAGDSTPSSGSPTTIRRTFSH